MLKPRSRRNYSLFASLRRRNRLVNRHLCDDTAARCEWMLDADADANLRGLFFIVESTTKPARIHTRILTLACAMFCTAGMATTTYDTPTLFFLVFSFPY